MGDSNRVVSDHCFGRYSHIDRGLRRYGEARTGCMNFRWSLAPPQPLIAARLIEETKLSSVLVQCLLNRNMTEASIISGFLEPRLKSLADPFLLHDMTIAVDRLFAARTNAEALVIFGDYDVDGVTSTAL